MWSFLRPEPHRPLLPKEQIDPTYKRLRVQVFIGIFIGYAGYYFVRTLRWRCLTWWKWGSIRDC